MIMEFKTRRNKNLSFQTNNRLNGQKKFRKVISMIERLNWYLDSIN